MEYHKLVRDKIPDRIRNKGEEARIHIADEKEYWQKLKEKLVEEVAEFCEAESAEEMADVCEVIDAIFATKRIQKNEVDAARCAKASSHGIFAEKIILEEA